MPKSKSKSKPAPEPEPQEEVLESEVEELQEAEVTASWEAEGAQEAPKPARQVKVPVRYAHSELVCVQKRVHLRSIFPEVQGADVVKLDIYVRRDGHLDVIAYLASQGETFWVQGQPYAGASAPRPESE